MILHTGNHRQLLILNVSVLGQLEMKVCMSHRYLYCQFLEKKVFMLEFRIFQMFGICKILSKTSSFGDFTRNLKALQFICTIFFPSETLGKG